MLVIPTHKGADTAGNEKRIGKIKEEFRAAVFFDVTTLSSAWHPAAKG